MLRTLSGTGAVGLVLLLAPWSSRWRAGALRAADRHPGPAIGLPLAVRRGVRPPGGRRLVVGDPRPDHPRARRRRASCWPPRRPARRAGAGAPARRSPPGSLATVAAVLVLSAALPWWSARAVRRGPRRAGRRPARRRGRAREGRPRRQPARDRAAPADGAGVHGPGRPARGRSAPTARPPASSRTNPQSWRALAHLPGPGRDRRSGRVAAGAPPRPAGPRGGDPGGLGVRPRSVVAQLGQSSCGRSVAERAVGSVVVVADEKATEGRGALGR